jgi:beta-glucosidase
LDAIKQKISEDTQIYYAKGCDILSNDKSSFKEAIELAKMAQVVVLVVGEKAGLVLDCTSGESRDRSDLNLPGVQEEFVREIHATGVPIILILINGRPLTISWEKEYIPAIVEAWLPGEEGADAIADVIFGDYNPGGKLPISIPRAIGQIPIYHNHKPTGGISVWTWNYVEQNTTPLFPFGYGLSYTKFDYKNLRINKPQVNIGDEIEISFEVKNIGKVSGDEVVQLYFHDREATITRPVEELVGFKRVTLKPNEITTFKFIISTKQLGFYNNKMEFIIEPGAIEVFVGSINSDQSPKALDMKEIYSKKDVKLRGSFEMIGKTLEISKDKKFFSKVKVNTIKN